MSNKGQTFIVEELAPGPSSNYFYGWVAWIY